MTLASGLIVGCIGVICVFFYLMKAFDKIYENNKPVLFFWKHFCISMILLSMLVLTATMNRLAYHDGDVPLVLDIMNMVVTINIIIDTAWFFYFAVITVFFYINSLSKSKDKIKYD